MITVIHDDDKWQLKELVPEELLGSDTVCICSLEDENELTAVLVARPDGNAVWEISYIYVIEELRETGIATEMVNLLILSLQPMGAMALTFNFLEEEGENMFSGFAQKMGFESAGSSTVFETSLLNARQAIEKLKQPRLMQAVVSDLKRISTMRWSALQKELELWRRDKGISDNRQLYVLPDKREAYNDEISRFATNQVGEPMGVLLVKSDGENNLSVDYMVNFRPGDPNLTIAMLREMCTAASLHYSVTDTMISFHAFNPNVASMGKSLLGRKLYEVGTVHYLVKYL